MTFFPPTEEFKRAVEEAMDEILPEKIMDLSWNEYFYLFDKLGSIKADETISQSDDAGGDAEVDVTSQHPGLWAVSTSNTATITTFTAADRLRLGTGTTQSSQAAIFSTMAIQGIIRFDRLQRFRSAFQVSSVADVTGYIVSGDNHTGQDFYYGFKIADATLQGVTKNNGSEATVNLQTISASTGYDIEARLLPGNKVLFLVRDADNPNTFEARGVLTTELPTQATRTDLATIAIQNDATADKQMEVSFFEYIQKR